MTERMKLAQIDRLGYLFTQSLLRLNLTEDEANRIIEASYKMWNRIEPILREFATENQRFGPAVNEFEFTVPSDYKHDTQLDTFVGNTEALETTYCLNNNLTSTNFANATNELVPCTPYSVKLFPVLSKVSSEECIRFLSEQGAVLVGAQGITLLQKRMPDEFPVGKWLVSFDEKEALWIDSDGKHRLLRVRRSSNGDWRFHLASFEGYWHGNSCILCFSELKPSVA